MKWFKNLNAVPKLMLAFSSVLCFLLPITYIALSQMHHLSERNMQASQRDVVGIDALKQVEVDEALMSRALITSALTPGNTAAKDSAEHDFQSLLADARASLGTAHARSIHPDLRSQILAAAAMLPDLERAGNELLAQAKTGQSGDAAASLKASLLLADQLREAVHQALILKKGNIARRQTEEDSMLHNARVQLSSTLCACILFGLLISVSVARGFSLPLEKAVEVLNHFENGDLTKRLEIDSMDEIGRLAKALNSALSNIGSALAQVGEASRSLSTASTQLAKAVEVMAGGAHEQAASLEETSASLEQITATVRQNSDNARQASQLSLSSRDAAEKGGTVVSDAMSAMNEISDASSKIAAIIRVIDEIAFQTNLLAVNASVEAARAREHGKGFAVVATEVRSLARRSSSAAKEIKALIGDSRRKVENGSILVNRSGQTLNDIVTSVKRVTDIVSEIAAASREQSTGIEQVNSAMLQMDSVLQSNSSQTEQLSATASTLASDALHLEQLISRFVVKTEDASPSRVERKATPSVGEVARTTLPFLRIDEGTTTSDSLSGLAANLGQPISTAALDEEFEEF